MKNFISLVLLISSAAAHADLKQFGQSRENTSYYEAASAKRTGTKVSVWTLTEYRQPEKAGFLSTRSHKEIDCKSQQERTVQYIAYAENKGQGQVVGEINEANAWQDIAPGTRNSRLLQMVCGA
jgi:hypothetical protein